MTFEHSTSTFTDLTNPISSLGHDESKDQLFFVSSYSDFEKLAHGPRGVPANRPINVFRFNASDGSMVLQNKFGDPREVINPAFSRYHPALNIVYTCTEDCHENGQIIAYKITSDGHLTKLGQVDAGGTSTCYLTIGRSHRNMLAVNYWDSTITVFPLDPETGNFTSSKFHSFYDPKKGETMKAPHKMNGGVVHSLNDASTIKERQADPHSHSVILDKYYGTVAYVPDLGKDVIRELYFNREKNSIDFEINSMPSGLCNGQPDGPRYISFHPNFNTVYVVNELSSTVAVFSVDRKLLEEISIASKNQEDMIRFQGKSTLTWIQSIKTLPDAYDVTMSTCGCICVHKSGKFLLVSNRGHESLAVFRVVSKGQHRGMLKVVGYFHTRGETPRHFKFDSSGQYLIVANQDSNSVAVFSFNLSSGEIKFTGNEYYVPSPNFVCCCPVVGSDRLVPYSVSEHESIKVESDLEESSDGSTMDANAEKDNLQQKLKMALLQVEELKQQLATDEVGI